MKITNEQIFSVPTEAFAISPSTTGYTLNYSADKTNFSAYPKATNANETLVVTGMPCGLYYKLVGNTGDVYIKY